MPQPLFEPWAGKCSGDKAPRRRGGKWRGREKGEWKREEINKLAERLYVYTWCLERQQKRPSVAAGAGDVGNRNVNGRQEEP